MSTISFCTRSDFEKYLSNVKTPETSHFKIKSIDNLTILKISIRDILGKFRKAQDPQKRELGNMLMELQEEYKASEGEYFILPSN